MNEPPTDDSIDALLREEPGYIEDQGFTARVISALPPRRRLAWFRPALILGATLLSLALAILWLAEAGTAAMTVAPVVIPGSETLAVLVTCAAVFGAVVSGAVAAIRGE